MDPIRPVAPRISPYVETHRPEAPEKSTKGAKGILTESRDKQILKTPKEIREDSAFVIPPKLPEKSLFVDEFTAVATMKYGDGFNFEKIICHFYQAMFAICERDRESLTEAIQGLRAETEAMGKEREKAFEEIYRRMSRDKTFEWIQLAATAIGTTVIGATVGGPVLMLLLASFVLQVNAVAKHPVEQKLDGVLFSEDQWITITTALSIGCSTVALFTSPGEIGRLGEFLQEISSKISLGMRLATSADQYQIAVSGQKKAALDLGIDYNRDLSEDTMRLLLAAKGQHDQLVGLYRDYLKMQAAATQPPIN